MPQNNGPTISGDVQTTVSGGHGAIFDTLHVSRRVKIYPIQEHEMRTLSLLNTAATTCFSLGGFFAGGAITLWLNLKLAGTQAANVSLIGGAIVLFVILAIIAVSAAIYFQCSRRSELNAIIGDTIGTPEPNAKTAKTKKARKPSVDKPT